MEPRQTGATGGERAPVQAGEILPAAPGELGGSLNRERIIEQRPEIGIVQAEAAQVAMPALPTPIVVAPDDASLAQADDSQLAAKDDDLIEKEWVDKAKKILAETKDDPYRREQAINKLQIEYVRKRYGRIIGDSGD